MPVGLKEVAAATIAAAAAMSAAPRTQPLPGEAVHAAEASADDETTVDSEMNEGDDLISHRMTSADWGRA